MGERPERERERGLREREGDLFIRFRFLFKKILH